MKLTYLVSSLGLSLAAVVTLNAQTAAKPTAMPTKPASTAAHSAPGAVKLPPGIPPVRGIQKTLFALRYQDIKIGAGPDAEPNKLYKVHYTGWLASDGHKFDSSYDHPRPPATDKDGKPIMGPDGKPKEGDPQPIAFPQGFGRVIPGWDQGFGGMKVGGKRRIFIPWQLAYGAKGRPGPDAAHPGIPPKADLIFDVELVDVSDMPMPPNHPGGMPPGMSRPMPGATPARPGTGTSEPGSSTPTAPLPNPKPMIPATPPPTNPDAPKNPAPPANPSAPTTPNPTNPTNPSTTPNPPTNPSTSPSQQE
jgi:peptidylprolyl isomerase